VHRQETATAVKSSKINHNIMLTKNITRKTEYQYISIQ